MTTIARLVEVPFRGREAEMRAIRDGLGAVRQGRGAVVVVRGVPGAGTTRLLAEARRIATSAGVRTAAGTAQIQGRTVPLAPLLDALISGPDPLLDPTLLPTLSTATDERFLLLRSLQQQLEQAALCAPVLLTIDDLQWADFATHSALRTLATRLAQHPVMWVLGVRSDGGRSILHATLDRLSDAGAQVVDLQPLGREAVGELARDVIGRVADERVLRLVRQADGTPQMLVELLRGLAEQGAPADTDGGADVDDLPLRFREHVARRVGHLPPPARRAVQVAAVLRDGFTLPQLADLLTVPVSTLLECLAPIMDEGLVIARAEGFIFRYDLIRQAIEQNLPDGVVRVLRRQGIETELRAGRPLSELAATLAATARPGDARAVALLRRAAWALATTDMSAAADLSAAALDLCPRSASEWGAMVCETVHLLLGAGKAAPAMALADQALGWSTAAEPEAWVRLGAALVGSSFSFAEAIRQCRLALRLPDLPAVLRADLMAVHALTTIHDGGRDAGTIAAGAWSTARAAGNLRAEALSVAVLALSEDLDVSGALLRLDEATALTARVPVGQRLWDPEIWRSMILAGAGRTDEALVVADHARKRAHASGAVILERLWTATRARLLLEAGRLAEARTEAETCTDGSDALGSGELVALSTVVTLGRVALLTGDGAASVTAAACASEWLRSASISVQRAGRELAAAIADSHDDGGRVVELLSAAARRGDEVYSDRLLDTDVVALVRIALRAGLRGVAAEAVDGMARRVRQNPHVDAFAAAHAHAHGLLDGDRAALARAVTLFADDRRPIPMAAALEDAGTFAAPHDPHEGVRLLATALRLLDGAGAQRSAARVRSRLRELGVHRRRAVRPRTGVGWESLTPTELDVVRLVTAGATNREAAQRLYLSPHTVSTHVRHTFDKLGITSRIELTRIALSRVDG